MTIKEIIAQLQKEGHYIKYRVRKDGGIIITRIDEEAFTGAKGNARARLLTGAKLSEARAFQLTKITPPKGKSPLSRKKSPIPDDLDKLLRKVQRFERKKRLTTPDFTQRTTRKKVRWNVENLGEARTIEKLKQNLKYAMGLAYDANIDALIGYINELYYKTGESILLTLAEDIDIYRDTIRESALSLAYGALYDINHGVSIRDCVERVRGIFGIQ